MTIVKIRYNFHTFVLDSYDIPYEQCEIEYSDSFFPIADSRSI